MDVCETCGASQFESVDGLYYCTFCQTQSQSLRDMEAEDEGTFASFNRTLMIQPAAKRKDSDLKKPKVDEGRPWTTYEGFQIVILNQVKALIQLGASNDLERVVFQLWSLYLSKVGVAFCDESEKSTVWETTRNRYVRNVGKPMTKKRRRCASPEGSQSQSDSDEPADWNLGQPAKGKDSKHRRAELKTMTMMMTTCFSYLGLMFTNPLTTTSEFIRWLKSGEVPYIKAHKLFPEDMKFSRFDWSHFCFAPIPTSDTLRRLCGKMSLLLELGTLQPVDLRKLASKFIVKLNLPGEFHHLMNRLFQDHVPVVSFTPDRLKAVVPDYEAIAMAYVVLLLKLTLGLNDQTERQLSQYGRRIAQLTKQEPRLFIWDDWVEYMKKRTKITENSFQRNIQLPRSASDVKFLSDLSPLLEYHKTVTSERNRYSDFQNVTERHLAFRPETRENLRRPLSGALLKMQLEKTDQQEVPLVVLDDPMQCLAEPDDEGTIREVDAREGEVDIDFSFTTITYITHEDVFLQKLESQPLSGHTVAKSCSSYASDSNNDEDSDDGDRTTDCGETAAERSDRSISKQKKKMIKRLLKPLIRGYDRYTVYDTKEAAHQGVRHQSYTWLLNVCSREIDCEVAVLEHQVHGLQLVHSLVQEYMVCRIKGARRRLLNKYFNMVHVE